MPDQVVISGKSADEVAANMAETILISIENKSWGQMTRQEYLQTVAQCTLALRGSAPKS